MSSTISVIIPAHNEEKYIARCIHSIKTAAGEDPVEIIVACNRCTDHTADIATAQGARVVEGKNSDSGAQRCTTPHLTEDEIKEAFCRALGELIADRDRLAEDICLLRAELADTEGLERKAAILTEEVRGINTQIAALIQQNAATAQDQEAYNLKYKVLSARYEKNKKKLDAVSREIESRAVNARALDAFERELHETESMNISFSTARWNAMVERVDVLPDGQMSFRFVCGREITV